MTHLNAEVYRSDGVWIGKAVSLLLRAERPNAHDVLIRNGTGCIVCTEGFEPSVHLGAVVEFRNIRQGDHEPFTVFARIVNRMPQPVGIDVEFTWERTRISNPAYEEATNDVWYPFTGAVGTKDVHFTPVQGATPPWDPF